jgi:uncharacterized protein YndB with AHSA1/START domain
MTANKPSFVYVTWIETTAEKVWQAVTDPRIAAQYWCDPSSNGPARVNESDWKVGSDWQHVRADGTRTVDMVGKVLESEPPHRLVMSWARTAERDDPAKYSHVTFDIAVPKPGVVKLTVMHADLEHDAKMFDGISNGWPMVLSNMKTLLETGRAIPRA